MIIYNITTKVSADVADEWITWQQEEHIPQMMATTLFTGFTFAKLLHQDDAEGPTYILQLFTSTLENYETYIRDHAPALREIAMNKWGNRFISFRSVLQTVK